MEPPPKAGLATKEVDALLQGLVAAEQQLEERSGVGSASSEGRDKVVEATEVQDKRGRLSNCSFSGSSSPEGSEPCSVNSLQIHKKKSRPEAHQSTYFSGSGVRGMSGVTGTVGSGSGNQPRGSSGSDSHPG